MISNGLRISTILALLAIPAASNAAPAAKPPQFATCAVCHKINKGEKPGIGPNLFGVGGTKAGELPGFDFSPAMKKSGLVWNRANLIKFITAPQKTVPGTKMAYAGAKPDVAGALADYLLSLK